MSTSERCPWSKRLRLCLVMVALESFISFEEIYMLAMLQRVSVPTAFVSTPGTFSSAIGVIVIPIIGWASDRFACCPSLGQKRPFAVLTLVISVLGLLLTLTVNILTLYTPPSSNATAADCSYLVNTSTNTSLSSFRASLCDVASSSSTRRDPNVSETVPVLNVSSSTRVNSTETADSSTGFYISALGILGILGFTAADHGYDSSASTTKAYLLAVTPPSQHSSLLVTATLAGAVGGCVTSVLGFVDLTPIFPPAHGDAILDHGAAQCLAQNTVLLLSVIVFGACSLATGTEVLPDRNKNFKERTRNWQKDSEQSETVFSEARSKVSDVSASEPRDPVSNRWRSTSDASDKQNLLSSKSKALKGRPSRFASAKNVWRQRKKMVFLCNMTFFSLGANYAYFVYVTNYVAEAIYKGDPYGSSDSAEYAKYVEGVRMGSLGMLAFYCLYVVFNGIHDRVLRIVKMRTEYLLACMGCGALTLTLAFTNNIVVFFVNAVTFAVFRSVVYTIPFILANNYAQEETQGLTGDSSGHPVSTGSAMAAVSAMIPASYFLVSLCMGPLMSLTGNPATPIVIAGCMCLVSFLSAFLVSFR